MCKQKAVAEDKQQLSTHGIETLVEKHVKWHSYMILDPIQTKDLSAHLVGFGHRLQELGHVRSEDHVDLDVEEEEVNNSELV